MSNKPKRSLKDKILRKLGKDSKSKYELDSFKKEIDIDEHKLSLDELCRRYNTNAVSGLTDQLAADLLVKNGPNALTPPKETPKIIQFFQIMMTGFAKLLIVSAIFCFVSYGIAKSQDPITEEDNIYLGVVLILVVIGTGCFQYFQKAKSDKIMESFKKMIPQEGNSIL